jgi:hypothetical protein
MFNIQSFEWIVEYTALVTLDLSIKKSPINYILSVEGHIMFFAQFLISDTGQRCTIKYSGFVIIFIS